MPRGRYEYRVWRKPPRGGDARATQGHYIIADSEREAIEAVMDDYDSFSDFDALRWKESYEGDYYPVHRTPEAKCFADTGDARLCRRKR